MDEPRRALPSPLPPPSAESASQPVSVSVMTLPARSLDPPPAEQGVLDAHGEAEHVDDPEAGWRRVPTAGIAPRAKGRARSWQSPGGLGVLPVGCGHEARHLPTARRRRDRGPDGSPLRGRGGRPLRPRGRPARRDEPAARRAGDRREARGVRPCQLEAMVARGGRPAGAGAQPADRARDRHELPPARRGDGGGTAPVPVLV